MECKGGFKQTELSKISNLDSKNFQLNLKFPRLFYKFLRLIFNFLKFSRVFLNYQVNFSNFIKFLRFQGQLLFSRSFFKLSRSFFNFQIHFSNILGHKKISRSFIIFQGHFLNIFKVTFHKRLLFSLKKGKVEKLNMTLKSKSTKPFYFSRSCFNVSLGHFWIFNVIFKLIKVIFNFSRPLLKVSWTFLICPRHFQSF